MSSLMLFFSSKKTGDFICFFKSTCKTRIQWLSSDQAQTRIWNNFLLIAIIVRIKAELFLIIALSKGRIICYLIDFIKTDFSNLSNLIRFEILVFLWNQFWPTTVIPRLTCFLWQAENRVTCNSRYVNHSIAKKIVKKFS